MDWNEMSAKSSPNKKYLWAEITENYQAGLADWILKILELAMESRGDWDVFVADLWPGDEHHNRLIGHVQKQEDAVGLDTGYRVCANLSGQQFYGEEFYLDDLEWIGSTLEKVCKVSPAKEALERVNALNPFELKLTAYGRGAVSEISLIWSAATS